MRWRAADENDFKKKAAASVRAAVYGCFAASAGCDRILQYLAQLPEYGKQIRCDPFTNTGSTHFQLPLFFREVHPGKGSVRIDTTNADYLHLLPSPSLNKAYLSKVQAVPETIFVDQKGNQIGESYVGSKSKAEWKNIIDSLLEQMQ